MYYDFKYVEYIGDNIFKIMVTNFLYSPFDSWGGFQIDKPDDFVNIDISIEYLFYRNNQFYLVKYGTFDSDKFRKCQQGSQRIYSIKLEDNKLNFTELRDELIDLFDLDYSENADFGYYISSNKDREAIKNDERRRRIFAISNFVDELYSTAKKKYRLVCDGEVQFDDIPVIDHFVYDLLIHPFLNKPLFEECDQSILDGFKTKYKVFLWHFFYNEESMYVRFNHKFTLTLVESYVLETEKYKYLYIKNYPTYKKDVLYRQLSFGAMCCGSGNYFFYHNKKRDWIDLSEDELKLRKRIYCLKCNKRLEKWEKCQNGNCFTCYN